jgi:hypothetical protein
MLQSNTAGSGPYEIKTVSTRFHPHRSTYQLLRILGATIRRRKHFGHVQNVCVSQRVQKFVLNPFRPLPTRMQDLVTTHCMKDYAVYDRVNSVLHCGPMRLEPGQYRYQYGIEIRVKILNMTKTFFSAASYSRNPSGIDTGCDAGLYGRNRVDTVLIPYGPGSKSGCV